MRRVLLLALVPLAATLAAPSPLPPVAPLRWTNGNGQITLTGAYDSARALVEHQGHDVTEKVQFSVADPQIASVTNGVVRPRANGTTVLTARQGKQALTIPVLVSGVSGLLGNRVPPFTSQVEPVLTRLGCNQGSCHGGAQGKGGFKLSLQGYDPEADYEAITRAAGARRISPAQPENSLLLRKPTLAVAHKGGKLIEVGSPEYRLLTDWIRGGMPAPQAADPTVIRLTVTPQTRTLSVGEKQRYQVWATFSNGERRDVSEQALFSINEGSVAHVTPEGIAKVVGKGEAAILVRYQDRVATASLLSPFAPPYAAPKTSATPIDRLVDAKMAALGLDASPRCSDSDYLRRVTLDLIGTLPTADEVRAFTADTTPDKREKLVETLLNRPEYVDFWALQWGDILRSTRTALNDKGLVAMNRWIRDSVAQNKPWNRWAQEILLARGSLYENGPANFYRAAPNPETLTENTAQVFLGVRMQCAKCHNHPYEKWRQSQYYELAAFFARVRTKPGEAGDERVVYTTPSGETVHPKTRKAMLPTALDAAPLPADFTGDRRKALADWLTSAKNPFFSRVIVNRLWRHFMGQGLVEPVDDFRVTNPPSNAALLDYLATDFAQNGYDIKRLMRQITRTAAYQRSAVPTPRNAADTRFYAHYPFKRLGAEVLLDAIGSATGVPEKFRGYPVGLRATQLPDATAQSYFLDLFGRPARNIVCQCERLDAPNLGQILHLMNGKGVNDRIHAKDGRVAQLLATGKLTDRQIITELYLASLSRFPTEEEEMTALMDFVLVTEPKDRQHLAEDLLWVLLNSKEFYFNH